jgi:hypothetical protein
MYSWRDANRGAGARPERGHLRRARRQAATLAVLLYFRQEQQ